MKSRTNYFNDFLARVSDDGFLIQKLNAQESDLIAEVYFEKCLFCSISKDGEIFYEYHDTVLLQKIENCALQSRATLDFCLFSPFSNFKQFSRIVNIAECAYWVVVESTSVALLYRFSGLFGYEFATCKKSLVKENRRSYYNIKRFYSLEDAYSDFYDSSGLAALIIVKEDIV